MSHAQDSDRPPAPEPRKKTYAPPTLTEYGSVAKLTMVKGSTQFESGVPNKKKRCL